MGTSIIGNVAVLLGLKANAFQRDINKAELSFKRFGRNMEKLGKSMSTKLTLPLAAIAGKSLQLFDNQAQAIAQVEAGLRSTGNAAGLTSKQLQDMASSLQNNSVFGDEDILKNVTANLLTFTNIAGEQFAQTQQAVIDLSARMGTDLKSASIQLGKALNDPIANLSALSRSGIQFTDAQKAMIRTMAEAGDIAGAQSVILKELENQFGGSAKAAAEAGLGGFKQLMNAVGDLMEQIGEALLPVVQRMTTYLKGVVAGLQTLTPEAKSFIVVIGAIAAGIGPVIWAFGKLVGIMPAVLKGIKTVGTAIKTTAMFIGGLSAPVLVAIGAISSLGAIGVYLYKNWEVVQNRMSILLAKMQNGIADFALSAISNMSGVLRAFNLDIPLMSLSAALRTEVPKMTGEWKTAGQVMGEMTSSIGQGMKGLAQDFGILAVKAEQSAEKVQQAATKAKNAVSSGQQQDFQVQGGIYRRPGASLPTGLGDLSYMLQGRGGILKEVSPDLGSQRQSLELTNMQIAAADALGESFNLVADAFGRTFIEGLTNMDSFAEAWEGIKNSLLSGLKEIAVQLVKMAAIGGIAKLLFPSASFGSLLTGTDLAQKIFQDRLMKRPAVSAGIAAAPQSPKMMLNANLSIAGQQLDTAMSFHSYKKNQLGF